MFDVLRKLWQQENGLDIAKYAVMLPVILVFVVGTIKASVEPRIMRFLRRLVP